MVALALLITIPALFGNSAGLPVAFFAVTSITTIGLYIAYILPLVTIVLVLGVWIAWEAGAKRTFKGPVRTLDDPHVGTPKDPALMRGLSSEYGMPGWCAKRVEGLHFALVTQKSPELRVDK